MLPDTVDEHEHSCDVLHRGRVVLLAKVDRVLGVFDAIDAAVVSIHRRHGGVSGGELVFAAAETMLTGVDFMVDSIGCGSSGGTAGASEHWF